MTEKRFSSYKNNSRIVGFKDNVTGKHHSSYLEGIWILNDLWEKNQRIEKHYELLKKENKELKKENEQLKKQLESEHTMLDNAILLERTRMGQNSLKQYKEAIQ